MGCVSIHILNINSLFSFKLCIMMYHVLYLSNKLLDVHVAVSFILKVWPWRLISKFHLQFRWYISECFVQELERSGVLFVQFVRC